MDEPPTARFTSRPLTRRSFLGAVALGSAGVVLGACGSSSSGSSTTGTGGGPSTTSFPVGAAAKASSKPVHIVMWHSMTNANLKTLEKLASQFNASQSDVKVSLVNQNSYTDTLTLYTAALGSGSLPDLVQMESIDLQLMIDSQSIVAAGSAVAADNYDLSQLVSSTVEYFKVGGTLWAMPFNVSSQVLYYDQNALTKAGLDPSAPPRTLEEYRSYSEKIVQTSTAKYGTSLKLDSSNFEDWLAQGGGLLVDNDNGRTARAKSVAFDDSLGNSLFAWFGGMLSSKLAQATPATGGGGYDNLLAIAQGIAPMSIDTSAALGTVLAVLGSGQDKQVKLGVGPLPAPPGPGGVPYGGAGLYISKKSSPENQDGAWQFIKFLLTPASQATWALGTGYIPINKASPSLPSVAAAWTKVPEYKVAYDQLLATKPSAATAGAVCGALAQVGTDLNNSLTAMSNGTTPAAAMSQAVSSCNSAISQYNARV